jgi:hypothetical protein
MLTNARSLKKQVPEPESMQDMFGRTPLHYATWTGNEPAVRMLLKKFPGIRDLKDNGGYAAVDMALLHGWTEIVDELVSHGAARPETAEAKELAQKSLTDAEAVGYTLEGDGGWSTEVRKEVCYL